MSDTTNYEVHPGLRVTGATPQPEIKYDIHPAIQQAQAPEPEPEIVETAAPVQEIQEPIEEPIEPEPQPEPQQEKAAKNSWNELRYAREKAERERDVYARRLSEYEKQHDQQYHSEPEEDLNISVNPDDLIEGKHLSKVDKKIKNLESQLKQYQQYTTQQNIKNMLINQLPDFQKVVSPENIEKLKIQEPELAYTLEANPDLYSMGVSAYKLIKNLGIYKENREDTFIADRLKAQQNANKPKPLASISPQKGETPLSHANAFAQGLTKDLQAQLYKEMMEAKKNI